MATFRVTSGFLTGTTISGNYPDNALPGDQPGIDNSLPGQPGFPDNTLPPAPPGIWPPPSLGNPIAPIIDNTLPVAPGTIWPSPGAPNRPDNTLPGVPGRPDNTLPGDQPGIDNTLPSGGGRPDNTLPSQTYWMLCYCPSLGWKYVAVDPSLRPGNALPPYAQPK